MREPVGVVCDMEPLVSITMMMSFGPLAADAYLLVETEKHTAHRHARAARDTVRPLRAQTKADGFSFLPCASPISGLGSFGVAGAVCGAQSKETAAPTQHGV